MTRTVFEQFKKERDEAAKSYDVQKLDWGFEEIEEEGSDE